MNRARRIRVRPLPVLIAAAAIALALIAPAALAATGAGPTTGNHFLPIPDRPTPAVPGFPAAGPLRVAIPKPLPKTFGTVSLHRDRRIRPGLNLPRLAGAQGSAATA